MLWTLTGCHSWWLSYSDMCISVCKMTCLPCMPSFGCIMFSKLYHPAIIALETWQREALPSEQSNHQVTLIVKLHTIVKLMIGHYLHVICYVQAWRISTTSMAAFRKSYSRIFLLILPISLDWVQGTILRSTALTSRKSGSWMSFFKGPCNVLARMYLVYAWPSSP